MQMGTRSKTITLVSAAALLFIVALLFLPLRSGQSTYVSVSAPLVGPLGIVDNLFKTAPVFDTPADYFIQDGELFLRTQTTRYALLLVTYVNPGFRTSNDVQAFRKRHPELEGYWPRLDLPDGGVPWTHERKLEHLSEASKHPETAPSE